MTTRLNAKAIAPDAFRAQKPLIELVKVRASQINGCAFCIAMHTAKAA